MVGEVDELGACGGGGGDRSPPTRRRGGEKTGTRRPPQAQSTKHTHPARPQHATQPGALSADVTAAPSAQHSLRRPAGSIAGGGWAPRFS